MLWTPLVVVTASHEGERGAQIAVSAFAASIVPDKPRVMVEIQKRNHTHALIDERRRFAINILPKEHWPWVRRFGFLSQSQVDRFEPAIPPDDAGSTDLDDGGEVHLLGYFASTESAALQSQLERYREGRQARGLQILRNLARLGVPVEWNRVLAIAGEAAVWRVSAGAVERD